MDSRVVLSARADARLAVYGDAGLLRRSAWAAIRDVQGWLESRDPEIGDVQWKHGGGMTWQPLTYDPVLTLIYEATGNPNPDTGKMKWYFQTSPQDSHNRDSTQVPVLVDAGSATNPASVRRVTDSVVVVAVVVVTAGFGPSTIRPGP